jgi:hypothetical protein
VKAGETVFGHNGSVFGMIEGIKLRKKALRYAVD